MTVNISKPPPSEKKYKTILADPPWPEYGCGKIKRGADRHYPLMSIKEIAALGKFVQSIAADDAHLYLWVTNNYLEAAFKVVAAWGFTYVTKIDWVKQGKPGLGQYFRGRSESVLFCKRGKPAYKLNDLGKRVQGETAFITPDNYDLVELEGAWFESPRMLGEGGLAQHSKKPPKIHEWAEKVSYGPFLEMFQVGPARPGWDRWGNGIFEQNYHLDGDTNK